MKCITIYILLILMIKKRFVNEKYSNFIWQTKWSGYESTSIRIEMEI